MESFNELQFDIKTKLEKARINYKKCSKDRLTVSYIEARLENIEQQWQLFYNTHVKIISEVKKSELLESTYFKNNVYDEVEEFFINFKSELKENLSKLKLSSSTVSVPSISNSSRMEGSIVKLPEIKIPMFSGKYIEWQTFRDLFVGLVHKNKLLDDAQRLYYLKGHLTGEAEQLLRNINVTSENYKCCWDKLESMYNNKKFLANGILKRLLNQKSLTFESAHEIKKLVNTTTDCLESIKNLGIDVSSWDILVIHLISAKLDRETRKAWELNVSSDSTDNLPTYTQFTDFLIGRFRCLENLDNRNTNVTDKSHRSTHSFYVQNQKKELCCPYCCSDHKIYMCKKFVKETSDTRRDFAQKNGVCFVCMGNNHSAKNCKSTFKCQICKRRHHTLLHPNGGSGSSGEGTVSNDTATSEKVIESNGSAGECSGVKTIKKTEVSDKVITSCLSTGYSKNTVLLTTALVKVKSKDGTFKEVRALLDQGSQGSFITEAMVQFLGLNKKSSRNTVKGVGGQKCLLSKCTVSMNIQSRSDSKFNIDVNAYVLKSITSLLPTVKTCRVEWGALNKADLADPEYYRPNKIDILLGAEVYSQIIKGGIERSDMLLAQDTTFGWIISGVINSDCSISEEQLSGITVMHASIQTEDLIKRFWELEAEPTGSEKMLSKEEKLCEQFFVETFTRNETGRYVVRLPFRDDKRSCQYGESLLIAKKRFQGLEYKLMRNLKLKEEYRKVIHEYSKLKHMTKVPKEETNKGLYLPHHAVIRDDKTTTKVRVVFDASCKGKNGVSLNDNLMVGPSLQADLRHIVMRWRRHPICIVADIIKMYRQVLVDRKDTMFQRIVWRDSPENEMEEFELVTVTFGTASAPFLAVRVLHQVAHDEGQEFPVAKQIILNDFYMDDLMTGSENIEEGYKIYKEISSILEKGGFILQKWKSNSQELLRKITKSTTKKNEDIIIKLDDVTKILGLTWDPSSDVFKYSVEITALDKPVTKRKMLSEISKLFDPLGWLAPSIILAKILIQKLWLAGISWDQEVPSNLLNEWITYRDDLNALAGIKIPRWMFTKSNDVKVELHGFSDASKLAYAAVVYVRVINAEGHIKVALVTSKTKVSPIKQVSIPRLELCGAVLLTKLLIEVAKVLNIPKVDLHAWTDSEIVLAWPNSHPSRWKTFVANRVSDILIHLDNQCWSYVASKENPADYASRGVAPRELTATSVWFDGPEFLKKLSIDYKRPVNKRTNLEEIKTLTCIKIDSEYFLRKYSSLYKMVRIVAYCRRFLNLRKKNYKKNCTTYVSADEIQESLEVCIKISQKEDFAEEITILEENKTVICKKFKSLNLFLDSKGILRVGGRLAEAPLEYGRKHPILLSRSSFLTKLLIADSHDQTMHGGPQAMVAYLRTNYWIIGVKVAVRSYFRKCVVCIRYSAKTTQQLMGQLPSSRVTPSKPFLRTGVDYAGPINIRMSKGRGNKSYKGYIALFICMSTRAIHLEVVSDLSSKGFLAAYRRFVARRGRCAELHSDNGTNFVGAARELRKLFDEAKSKFVPELAEYLANNGTKWSFIPPHAPNFGGLWEAGIKSTKYHLRRVVGNSTLTYEELATVLAQIEACLNSRPLSYTNSDDEVLTPAHFLVGEPLVMVPETNFEKSQITTLRRWQLSQRIVQDFWRRWSGDYLNQFLQRHKWSHQVPEPAIGDVVLIKEDDMPPGKWLLGKIENKHPGPDGITRVITIRTKNSIIKRAVSKVCVLVKN